MTELERFILSANYDSAELLYREMSFDTFSSTMIAGAFDQPSFSYYTFLASLLIKQEEVRIHHLAVELLILPLCHIEGAYFSALYHVRKILYLTNGKDLAGMEMLLFLSEVPDQVVAKEEASQVAQVLLTLDHSNQIAREYVKNLKTQEKKNRRRPF